MLQITVPGREQWDEVNETFIYSKDQTLQLEHSLVSLSKWESKYCKPFLYTQDKTYQETLDYIKFMTITQNVKPETYMSLTKENISEIDEYIRAPMTATYISERKNGKINNERVTAELIYYWMIALNIPFECQKWHLNRLITLINVCNVKNQPVDKNKVSTADRMSQYMTLNEARKKQLNSKG